MGLISLILLGMCMNSTCPGDRVFDVSLQKKSILQEQSEQLRFKHLKIVTTQNPPLSYTEFENGTIKGRGIAFEIIDFLQEKYNFDYEVVVPEEDSLDYNAKGIIGMLHRDEADLAAAFLPIVPHFWSYVRYSRSLDKGEWVVLMNRPPVSATGSGLLAPFTFQVWLLILVSLLLVGPLIYVIIVVHSRLCKYEENNIYPLHSYVWFVYGALLKQGSTLSPQTDSSRLLFATWWIFITILTAFYTANLTAFLTLSRFTLPINSLTDIGAKKYPWVTHKGSAIEEAALNEPYFQEGIKGSRSLFLENNASSILEYWVKRLNYVYIGEKPIVEHLMYKDYLAKVGSDVGESNRCTYVITTWTIKDHLRAFAYSKKFPFHDIFNNIIEHLVESGIIKYLLRVGLPDTQICPLDLGSKERQLQNNDLLMTYYIVGGGFVVSTVVFVGELLLLYCKSRNKTREMGAFHAGEASVDGGISVYEKFMKKSEENMYSFPPPPSYYSLFKSPFATSPDGKMHVINGRNYWVVKAVDGSTQLIPVRTPSAFLFQYTN